MNLYDIYTDQEKEKIFKETNIKIEDKDYTMEERKKIAYTITEEIMNKSFKNNEINNNFLLFNSIIDKLKLDKKVKYNFFS